MKTWLKSFFKGMWMACQILIAVIVFERLITALLWGIAWFKRTVPTSGANVTVICICFIVAFGLLWTYWD